MTTKTKVRVSVAIIILVALMAAIGVAGICLTINKNYTFNGKVSFTSADVNATITKANISGGVLSSSDKMQEIQVNGLITETEDIKSWTGLDFKLEKDSKDVEIRFNIINHSTDKTLKIDLGEIKANLTNASISARFDGVDAGTTTAYIARAKTDQQGTVTEESFKQVIITLHVNKKNKDASITNFNIPVVLQNIDAYIVNLTSQSVEVDANAMVYTDVNASAVKLNRNLELCGNLITIINQSEYDFNYRLIFNNGTPNSYVIKAGKHIVLAFDKDSNVIITSIVKVN